MSKAFDEAMFALSETALWIDRHAAGFNALPNLQGRLTRKADDLRAEIARLERNALVERDFLLSEEDRKEVVALGHYLRDRAGIHARQEWNDRDRKWAALLMRLAGLGPKKPLVESGPACREETNNV